MIGHNYHLANTLKLHLKDAEEIWIAVALMSTDGLNFIRKHLAQGAMEHYLVGVDLPTPPDVLQTLLVTQSDLSKAKYFQRPNTFYHPKLYLIKDHKGLTAYVGSGNCTMGGLEKNMEISLRTDDENTCKTLKDWFSTQFTHSKDITEDFIAPYRIVYQRRQQRIAEDRKEMQQVFGGNSVNLDDIDFTEQFFKKVHFSAFEGAKPYSHLVEHDQEREAVRTMFYHLHHEIEPLIKSQKWDLHRHYEWQNVVSSAVHNSHTSLELDGMWLHYGRDEDEIKVFGENETPINFMRMQIIIHKDAVGIWNRVGRDKHGSKIDRTYLKSKLNDSPTFREKFFNAISHLPEGYFIQMNGQKRWLSEFSDEATLTKYLMEDNLRDYLYFGIDFHPADSQLSKTQIAKTVIKHFDLLYPTYHLILHNLKI